MIILTFVAVWLAILIAPQTPIGRALAEWVVERPAAWLGRLRRGHVALMAIIPLGAALALQWGGADAAAMMTMGAPELVGWLVMADIATYLDVAITVAIVASTVRWRPILGHAMAHLIRRPGRGRSRRIRTPRRRTRRPADIGNDGRPGWSAVAWLDRPLPPLSRGAVG